MNQEYINLISKASRVDRETVRRIIASQYLLSLLEIQKGERKFRTPFGVISMELGLNKEDPLGFTYLLHPSREFKELTTGRLTRETISSLVSKLFYSLESDNERNNSSTPVGDSSRSVSS